MGILSGEQQISSPLLASDASEEKLIRGLDTADQVVKSLRHRLFTEVGVAVCQTDRPDTDRRASAVILKDVI